ncbi:GTPase IMAP family member 8 [Biomphalaria glabrata]|nr:GTPase IMAP family member 8-like [Biomphalaria glabrata]
MLNVILLGNQGTGKSVVGNILLGKSYCSNSDYNSKSDPVKSTGEFKGEKVSIIDGLQLLDENDSTLYAKAETALKLADVGVDAFLIVRKFGESLVEDEEKLTEKTKLLFGKDIIKDYGIIVLTHEDNYRLEKKIFQDDLDWFNKKGGLVGDLFEESGKRCVVFNNKIMNTQNLEQVERLWQFIHQTINMHRKRYTLADFFETKEKRRKLTFKELCSAKVEKSNEYFRTIQERIVRAGQERNVQELELIKANLKAYFNDISIEFPSNKYSDIKYSFDILARIHMIIIETNVKIKSLKPIKENPIPSTLCSTETPTNPVQDYQEMCNNEGDEKEVTFIIFGNAGNGKSATGNSILGRNEFQTSTCTSTKLSKCGFGKSECEGLKINVIDCPSFNIAKSSEEQFLFAKEWTKEALMLCNYRFSALLYIFKYGSRFTKEEREAIDTIKILLGDHVVARYGLCIVTHGDNFLSDKEHKITDFHKWCSQQEGHIQHFFLECKHRYFMFDNETKDKRLSDQQLRKLLEEALKNKQYTKQEYEDAQKNVHEIMVKINAPKIFRETNEEIQKQRLETSRIDMLQVNDEKLRLYSNVLKEIWQFESEMKKQYQDSYRTPEEINILIKEINSKKHLNRLDNTSHRGDNSTIGCQILTSKDYNIKCLEKIVSEIISFIHEIDELDPEPMIRRNKLKTLKKRVNEKGNDWLQVTEPISETLKEFILFIVHFLEKKISHISESTNTSNMCHVI